MRARIKKLTALTALMLAGLMLLCACEGKAEAVPEMTLSTYVPHKGEEQAAFETKLYFLSDDGLYLSVEEREIQYDSEMSRAEAAIEALIDGPESSVLRASVPGDMALQRVETSYEACNVYLLASHTPEAREWLTARAAIAATVFACEDIPAVNLYLNGMALGYYGRATGAMQPITSTLDAHIVSLQQEYREIYSAVDTDIYENRTATLYFTDDTNTLLIAKNITLNYDSAESAEGIAALLISKLVTGAGELSPVLPQDFALAGPVMITPLQDAEQEGDPDEGDSPHPDDILSVEIIEEQDPGMARGETSVITLNIREPETPYSMEVMCGALTMTLAGYIPDIQGVAINVIDEGGKGISLGTDAYFTREDFSDMLGRIVHIACPDKDGMVLRRVPRAMTSVDSYDPLHILGELFADEDISGGMYTYFSPEDVADIYITGSTVVVDWKAGFEEALRSFTAGDSSDIPQDKRERMFIYSVVNTLTELEGVSRVWMLEEGKKLGSIEEIYLGNALMRNPGILVDD